MRLPIAAALLLGTIGLSACRSTRPSPGAYDPRWATESGSVSRTLGGTVPHATRTVVVASTDRGRFYDVRDLTLPIPDFRAPRLELSDGRDEFDRFDEPDEEGRPQVSADDLVDMIQREVGPDREVRLVGNGHVWVGHETSVSERTR